MLLIKNKSANTLLEYLQNHESDIAHGINDFGDLKDLFVELFNREPKEK